MAKQTFTTGQVLTAAQMTSLQQTAMLGGAASAKTASYTLVAADAGTAITMSNAGATTITVNTGLFAAGDTVHITNLGAGVSTITAGTATVNSSASLALAQYESGFLDFTSTSAAIFVKGAGAAAPSGGMTLLSTTTLSGASTTISSINQTYNSLYLVIQGVTNASSDGNFIVRPNNSSSITSYVRAWSSTINMVEGGEFQLNLNTAGPIRTSANNVWILQIDNYASTTNYKGVTVHSTFERSGPNQSAFAGWGGFGTNSAITSLVFSNSGGNLSTGTVLLYGVK
jgi:hypothetical protein